jgi:hypothetical protein
MIAGSAPPHRLSRCSAVTLLTEQVEWQRSNTPDVEESLQFGLKAGLSNILEAL